MSAVTTEDPKIARRLSRRQGLFAPDLLKAALRQAVVALRPDRMWKNPVMFVVEVGTLLSIVYTVYKVIDPDSTMAPLGYLIALDMWLILTVLFANFAEALAEARGKAQADALRKTRQETPAYRWRKGEGGRGNEDSDFSSALRTPSSSRRCPPTSRKAISS